MPSITLIKSPGEFALTGNSMLFAFQANNLENTSLATVEIRVRIFDNKTGTYKLVSHEAQPFDNDGIATFFIQELFSDKRLQYEISDMSGGTFDFIRYRVNWRMTWFQNGVYHAQNWISLNTTSELHALPGGVSREYEANWRYYDMPIEDLLESLSQRWLSNHPQIKKLHKGQKDFLSFLTMNHAENLSLVEKKKGQPETTIATFTSASNNKIIMRAVDADVYFANNVEEVTIYLQYNGRNIAQRTYFIDGKANAETSVFYFRNSFGTIDSIVCSGNLIAERKIEGNIFQAGIIETPSLTSPDIISNRKTYNTEFKADIGYHYDRDFQNFITELTISNDVWRTENDIIFPVIVDVKEYTLIDEKNNNVLHAEIKWQRTFIEKYLTKDVSIDYSEEYLYANEQPISVTIIAGNISPVNMKIESSSPWTIHKLDSSTFYNFTAMTGPAGTTTIKILGNGNVTGTALFTITNEDGLTVTGTVIKRGRIVVDNNNPLTKIITGRAQSFSLNVNSDQPFTIVKNGIAEWINIAPLSGGGNGVNVTVTAAANIDTDRTAVFTINNNYATCLLTITQNVITVYYLIDKNGKYIIDNQYNYLISY